MALFKIDLRLKPSPDGEHQLAGWPAQEFRPDFMVASSGLARFELESKVIGVTAEGHQPTATTTDHLNAKQINYWLPDYTGGFALNLAQATVQLRNQGRSQVSAKFIDEPLELRLARPPEEADGLVKISFLYNGETITSTLAAFALVIAEIGRTLQDFVVQLLTVNPRLTEQSDVALLQELIGQIVSPLSK